MPFQRMEGLEGQEARTVASNRGEWYERGNKACSGSGQSRAVCATFRPAVGDPLVGVRDCQGTDWRGWNLTILTSARAAG